MAVAAVWAQRSTCERGAVGCVIADDRGVVVSSGYNGAPPGAPHCQQVGCLIEDGHCVRAVHAEVNAITAAARRGVALEGTTAYLTVRPCLRCLYLLMGAGVQQVIYYWDSASEDQTLVALLEAARRQDVELRRTTASGWFDPPPFRQLPKEH